MKIYIPNIRNITDIKEKLDLELNKSSKTDIFVSFENELKNECNYFLYIITPLVTNLFTIAELIDDVIKHPEKTIFYFSQNQNDKNSFTKHQIKSLKATAKSVEKYKGLYCENLDDVVNFFKKHK